jgi:hypothetical protein
MTKRQKRNNKRPKKKNYELNTETGVLDRDFDGIEDAEYEVVEGLVGHGGSEDND